MLLPDTYHIGDCLELLRAVPAESVDLVLTDPPYGIGYQSNRGRSFRTPDKKRFPPIAGDLNVDFFPELLDQLYRVLKPNRAALIFTCWQTYPVQDMMVKESRFERIKHTIIWDKMLHGTGDIHNDFAPQYELILYLTKGLRKWKETTAAKRPTDILSYMRVSAQNMVHPCEKPVELLRYLIEVCTRPGELVLDPYAGSFSTARACKSRATQTGDFEPRNTFASRSIRNGNTSSPATRINSTFPISNFSLSAFQNFSILIP
jgi:DNA modification methylase